MAISMHHPLVFIFGILGNIISFMVYLAPIPTFYRICKKKSTEGFQSVPYLVALFSAMLWIYYAMHKTSDYLLITINSFGCVIETIYIAIFIAYAPKQPRALALKLLSMLNFGGFSLIILVCHFLAKGSSQVKVLGWLCVALSVGSFAAPLSIMRLVIRTKSVEFMPFYLSFFLTLSAVMWLFYGLLLKDLYVALPNVLGLIFGVIQMVLYGIYKNKKVVVEKQKLPEHVVDVVEISAIKTTSDEVLPASTEKNTNDAHDLAECNAARDQNYVHGQAQYCAERSAIAAVDHCQLISCAA